MVFDLSFNTPETDALCKEIAKRSKGVCLLGFSGGKDAVCAYLNLSRYFTRIVPFHCATLPNLPVREEALRYYENVLETHIYRMAEKDVFTMMARMIYQLYEDEEFIDSLDYVDYDKCDVAEYLRYKLNLPKAWCAFGINACDSLERRFLCSSCGGMHEEGKSFYPTWNWPKKEILGAIRANGIKLSNEYNHFCGSIDTAPTWHMINKMRKYYPKEYAILKDYLPLCDAELARQDFRREILKVDERGHKLEDDKEKDGTENGGRETEQAEGAEAEGGGSDREEEQ